MKRPAPMSLPAKYLTVLLGITAGFLVMVVAIGHELGLLPILGLVATALLLGWYLREAFTAWNNHRKLAAIRAQKTAVAAAFLDQLRAGQVDAAALGLTVNTTNDETRTKP